MFNESGTGEIHEELNDETTKLLTTYGAEQEEDAALIVDSNTIPPSIAATFDFDLAPVPPLTGTKSICFISISWQERPRNFAYPSKNVAKIADDFAAKTFQLSGGRFKIVPSTKSITVPHDYTKPRTAENYAVTTVDPNRDKFDSYTILSNNNTFPFSYASSNIVVVPGVGHVRVADISRKYEKLARSIYHENFHLAPFNLGHTSVEHSQSAYFNTDFMNLHPACNKTDLSNLNPMHLYLLGWLPRSKVCVYQGGNASFFIEPLYATNTVCDDIKAVFIPTNDGAPLMLAVDNPATRTGTRPQNLFFLYKAVGQRQHNRPFGAHTKQVLAFRKAARYEGFEFTGEFINGNEARINISRPAPSIPH